jgi:hypothetical protein
MEGELSIDGLLGVGELGYNGVLFSTKPWRPSEIGFG